MRKMKYTLDYLNQQLREKEIFNIDEVLFAIIETNVTLTVLKKPQYRNVTRQDLMIMTIPESRMTIELIMDGEIIYKNLEDNNLPKSWLETELKNRNIAQNDIVYAALLANGNIYIDTYRDHLFSPIDKE